MSYLPVYPGDIRQSRKNIDKALASMAEQEIEFSAVVVRGMSGALMVEYVAEKQNIFIVVVRKEGETTHGCKLEGGYAFEGSYIILDDFVSSGETVGTIREKMNKSLPHAKCVGVLLYSNNPSQIDMDEYCHESWANTNMHEIPIFGHMGEIELDMLYPNDEEDSPYYDLVGKIWSKR